ncbi:MAG: aldehyde dehydrogenase family protein [Chitinophagia bacterium]|nr:aldehyde dehydrogenase family protein [Chitinophagia bacterium]
MNIQKVLKSLSIDKTNIGVSTGAKWIKTNAPVLTSHSPVDGKKIATATTADEKTYNLVIDKAAIAFNDWRMWPAPKRGEVVRQIGNELRKHKEALGTLVSYEMGKSLQEGLGEVQEMIDIADFAVGLSRQLYGLTIHSERPMHRMYEQWHPLGVVGIISAFNFPVAVWSWNSFLAWVCGNTCVWKPSEKTPLTAIACQKITEKVFKANGVPEGVSCLINGAADMGILMSKDARVPLVSATGSTRMGKAVAATVAGRLGKSLLELGGNNAIIISQHADLNMSLIGAVFGAVGTAGQRCTTTRRLIIHESIYDAFKKKLVAAYKQIKIGNPLDATNHVGPLIDQDAVNAYLKTVATVKKMGGKEVVKAGVLSGKGFESACYVKPCIFEVDKQAIALQNAVPQGLSSAIMTLNMREAETFLSHKGSDCGIANVNIGTSGAEIGGAFGGEKETGGGRESGSDSWKVYMRRQTNTINWSDSLPLAQGIKFNL